jgi:hypothetical protein
MSASQNWKNLGKPGTMLRFVDLFLSLRIVIIHWIGAQNDMLTWLMSEARGVERSLEGLARRLLLVNSAAINPTSLVCGITVLLAVFGPYSHAWCRRLRECCTASFPTPNISNPSAKRSKLLWLRKVGRKLVWTRCARSTASYGRPNESTQRASVR